MQCFERLLLIFLCSIISSSATSGAFDRVEPYPSAQLDFGGSRDYERLKFGEFENSNAFKIIIPKKNQIFQKMQSSGLYSPSVSWSMKADDPVLKNKRRGVTRKLPAIQAVIRISHILSFTMNFEASKGNNLNSIDHKLQDLKVFTTLKFGGEILF